MAQWTLDASVGIVCEVAFTTGPLDTPTWTDISSFLDKEWWTFRGKESENDELQPGYFTIHLDNSARTFDPEHAAGPYFGNLKPMKKIRLRVAVGAFSATIISGYVLGWPQDWGTFKSVAAVQCIDGNRLDNKLPNYALETEVLADTPQLYWPLQEQADGRWPDTSGNARNGYPGMIGFDYTYTAVSTEEAYPIGASTFAANALGTSPLSDPANGTAFVSEYTAPAWTEVHAAEFWVNIPTQADDVFNFDGALVAAFGATYFSQIQVSIDLDPTGVAMLTTRYSHVGDNRRLLMPTSFGLAPGLHHIVYGADATNSFLYLDGFLLDTRALTVGTNNYLAPGNAPPLSLQTYIAWAQGEEWSIGISHVSYYTTLPSAARVKAHYLVGRYAFSGTHQDDTYGWEYGGARIGRVLDDYGWPSADRDLQPGGTRQAPYEPSGRTAQSYIRDVETSEHPGLFFFSRDNKPTFRDRQWLWSRTPAVTFNDIGTGIEYTASNPRGNDVSTIRNLVTVTYARTGAITNRDQASIDEYGEQPIDGETLEAPTMGDAQDASNLGRFRVRTRKQPQTTIPQLMAEMSPNSATQIPAVLGLELGDVVAFQRTPMSVGSAIVKKFLVLGIGHHVTARAWTVTLYLSPPILAAADAPYLTAGDATRGKVGAAFGNIVPF